MNLTKEQLQKTMFGGICLLAGLYGYFALLLGPLSAREKKAEKLSAELAPKIQAANTQIKRTKAMESGDPNAEAVRSALEMMQKQIPGGAAIVWLPQRYSEFFSRHGIAKSHFNQGRDEDLSLLKDFRKTSWTVDLPEVEFPKFAAAVAALENEQALIQIQTVRLDTKPDDVERQSVTVQFSTLAKK